jgi:hypothetical protein
VPARIFRLAALLVALGGPATAQVAILQIQVVEGEGAVHAPGSRSSRPLTVEVTDETGRPVAGAAVSFHLPEEGASGTFGNGLRTEVATTDAKGRASLYGLQVNRIGGRFQIRIVASKEQARAGVISFQYVAETSTARRPSNEQEPRGAAGPGRAAGQPAVATHRHSKWLIVAAVVAGGAAAGVLGATRTAASKSAPAPPTPTLTIGAPTVVVVKP